jgi:hypothetical protein
VDSSPLPTAEELARRDELVRLEMGGLGSWQSKVGLVNLAVSAGLFKLVHDFGHEWLKTLAYTHLAFAMGWIIYGVAMVGTALWGVLHRQVICRFLR